MTASDKEVQELKDELLAKYGVRVDEVNATINRRVQEAQKIEKSGVERPTLG
jgi:hypothetical protein